MADAARVGEEAHEDADATAAWSDVIRKRVDQIEAGTAELEDWETVRARLEAIGKT